MGGHVSLLERSTIEEDLERCPRSGRDVGSGKPHESSTRRAIPLGEDEHQRPVGTVPRVVDRGTRDELVVDE